MLEDVLVRGQSGNQVLFAILKANCLYMYLIRESDYSPSSWGLTSYRYPRINFTKTGRSWRSAPGLDKSKSMPNVVIGDLVLLKDRIL